MRLLRVPIMYGCRYTPSAVPSRSLSYADEATDQLLRAAPARRDTVRVRNVRSDAITDSTLAHIPCVESHVEGELTAALAEFDAPLVVRYDARYGRGLYTTDYVPAGTTLLVDFPLVPPRGVLEDLSEKRGEEPFNSPSALRRADRDDWKHPRRPCPQFCFSVYMVAALKAVPFEELPPDLRAVCRAVAVLLLRQAEGYLNAAPTATRHGDSNARAQQPPPYVHSILDGPLLWDLRKRLGHHATSASDNEDIRETRTSHDPDAVSPSIQSGDAWEYVHRPLHHPHPSSASALPPQGAPHVAPRMQRLANRLEGDLLFAAERLAPFLSVHLGLARSQGAPSEPRALVYSTTRSEGLSFRETTARNEWELRWRRAFQWALDACNLQGLYNVLRTNLHGETLRLSGSLINHSCVPNAKWVSSCRLVATVALPRDSQIFVCWPWKLPELVVWHGIACSESPDCACMEDRPEAYASQGPTAGKTRVRTPLF